MKTKCIQALKRNPLFLPAVALPLLFALYWHCFNRAYPKTDESSYFLPAVLAYNKLKASGLGAWLGSLYSTRTDLKPVIVSVIASPFVILTGGSVLATVAVNGIFLYGIFLSYVYLFLAEWLGGVSLLIGTWMLGFHPLFFHNALKFNTENPFLAFYLGALYHLKKSEYFKYPSHSLFYALFFALTFMVRPLEALVYLGASLALYVAFGFRAKKIAALDLKVFAVSVAAGLGILVFLMMQRISFHGFAHNGWAVAASISVLTGLACKGIPFLSERFSLSRNFLFAWAPALLAGFFWFFPYMPDLFGWAAGSSFTGTTKAPENRQLIHQLEWMFDKAKYLYGYQALWLGAIAAAASLIPSHARKRKARAGDASTDWVLLTFILLLPFCILPLFAASFTGNAQSDRYYYPATTAALLTLLVIGMKSNVPFLRARQAAIAVFVLLQIHFVGKNVLGDKEYDTCDSSRLVKWAAGQHPGTHYPWRDSDPLLAIIRELVANSDDPKFPTWSMLPNEGYGIDGWLDPDSGTDMLAAEMNITPSITYFDRNYLKSTPDPLEDIAKRVGLVILGPVEFPCATGWSNTPPEDNLTPEECALRAQIAEAGKKPGGPFRFLKLVSFKPLHPLNIDFRNGQKVENLESVHFAIYKSKYLVKSQSPQQPGAPSQAAPPPAPAPVAKIEHGPRRSTDSKASPASVAGLSLWLSADTLKADAQNVQTWSDASGGSRLVLAPSPDSPAPKIVSKAVNGHPVVRFEGKQRLETKETSANSLLSPDQATVFAVVKFAPSSRLDGFGWGDCMNNRFMAHFSIDGKIIFISGAPAATAVSADPAALSWQNDAFHLVTLERNRSTARIFIDGVLAATKSDAAGAVELSGKAPFFVGSTRCQLPFVGDLAELAVFKVALPNPERRKIEAYLSSRFGIPIYD